MFSFHEFTEYKNKDFCGKREILIKALIFTALHYKKYEKTRIEHLMDGGVEMITT